MINEQLASLVKQAKAAEDELSKLRSVATSCETTRADRNLLDAQQPSGNVDVLRRLTELQKLILEDRTEAEELVAHRNELNDENVKLRTTVEKQKYQILHLIRTIEEMEKKK